MNKHYLLPKSSAIASVALAICSMPCLADDDMQEAYQLTAVTKSGATQSVVLKKAAETAGPRLYNTDKVFAVNGKRYDIADLAYFKIEKTMVSAITDIGADNGCRNSGKVYNINGQTVKADVSSLHHLPKGIYIVNGKKYIVK